MVSSSWSFAIICAGALFSLLLFFGFIVLMRYINFKENMLLAEKGISKHQAPRQKRKGWLIWGIMISAIGLALCLGLYPLGLSGTGMQYPFGLGPWMIGGFLPLFIGIGLVLVYILTGNDENPDNTTETDQIEGLESTNGSSSSDVNQESSVKYK